MFSKPILAVILLAALPGAAAAQSANLPDMPADPRDRYSPPPESGPNPNRLDLRAGSAPPLDNTPDAPAGSVDRPLERVPGSADTLVPMGDMAIYSPDDPASATGPTSLPGMSLYAPPGDGGSSDALTHPDWWPK